MQRAALRVWVTVLSLWGLFFLLFFNCRAHKLGPKWPSTAAYPYHPHTQPQSAEFFYFFPRVVLPNVDAANCLPIVQVEVHSLLFAVKLLFLHLQICVCLVDLTLSLLFSSHALLPLLLLLLLKYPQIKIAKTIFMIN